MSRQIPVSPERTRTTRRYLKSAILTGTAIVIPVLLTVVVLLVALDFVTSLLNPLAIPIHRFLGNPGDPGAFTTALAGTVLGMMVVALGALAESQYAGDIEQTVDRAMASLPGISTIHGTLDQISEMLVESDTDSFQEVVLVEYPVEGSYSVAFKTAEPPEVVCEAVAAEEMITVFMPMGPNPFMGGFILHIGADRVHDVDLTVEEGVTSVVSFGVAVDQEDLEPRVDD